MEYVNLAARILVGAVFAVAAVAKALDLGGFARSLRTLVPEFGRFSAAGAVGVVAAEAGIALALAIPGTASSVSALWLALLFDAAFWLVLLRALRRHTEDAACRCFGQWSSESLSSTQFGRNAALAAACAAGLLATPPAHAAFHAQGLMIAVFCGVVGAVLVICADDLVDLVRPRPLPA